MIYFLCMLSLYSVHMCCPGAWREIFPASSLHWSGETTSTHINKANRNSNIKLWHNLHVFTSYVFLYKSCLWQHWKQTWKKLQHKI
jgi:hypothetical protein